MLRSHAITAGLLLSSVACLNGGSSTPSTEGVQRAGTTIAVGPLTVRLDGNSHAQRTNSGLQNFEAKVDEELQFVEVSVRNTSDEPVQLIARWTLIDEQHRIYKPTGGCMRATPGALTTLEPLQPDKTRKGKLCFLVNQDASGFRLDVQGSPDEEPARFALD